ncbi:MAG TPA: glutaredoxin family protein [Candidatus Acidoferrales bacterium]|nr:glutaredoxin family protein [Candidatus Acidoferrales bacterium]
MNPIARTALEVFDLVGARTVPRRALEDALAANGALCRETCEGVLNDLVRERLISAEDGGVMFRRTELGRLALAGPMDLTLYTRAGCHLCEEMRAALRPLLHEFGARLGEVDVDEDVDLSAMYGSDVPVLLLGGRKVAKHRLDVAQMRRQLAVARGR